MRTDADASPSRRQRAEKREGAAMLMVLMVLLMTTATATFAIHATTMELRSAGHARTAMQTQYVAEGGAYAALAYMDATGAQATFIQYIRTQVNANQTSGPNARNVIDQNTNLLRIEMDDFTSAPGVNAPPIENDPARVPSLGPRTNAVATFTADGSDMYRTQRRVAGRDQTGRDPFSYVRINLTARSRMAPPTDVTTTSDLAYDPADPRSYNESAAAARAMAEMGPFAGGS